MFCLQMLKIMEEWANQEIVGTNGRGSGFTEYFIVYRVPTLEKDLEFQFLETWKNHETLGNLEKS